MDARVGGGLTASPPKFWTTKIRPESEEMCSQNPSKRLRDSAKKVISLKSVPSHMTITPSSARIFT